MRSYAQAKAFAVQQHRSGSDDWFRTCRMFARQCVGAGPFGMSARPAFNALPDLQVALMRAGFPFADGPTARYGRHTRQCCARFQQPQGWRGPAADGLAGPGRAADDPAAQPRVGGGLTHAVTTGTAARPAPRPAGTAADGCG
jgi:hypothetical protein